MHIRLRPMTAGLPGDSEAGLVLTLVLSQPRCFFAIFSLLSPPRVTASGRQLLSLCMVSACPFGLLRLAAPMQACSFRP